MNEYMNELHFRRGEYVLHDKADIYKNDEYLSNNSTWHSEDSPYKANQIFKLLQKNNIVAKTICDVGCGSGEVIHSLQKLLPQNIEYTGYDISTSVAFMWEKQKNENITFKCGDFSNADDTFFDIACYIDVIEHIEDYIAFLKRIKNKSRYKVFAFPLEISAIQAIFRHLYTLSFNNYGHLHFFNKDIILLVLNKLEFNIVDVCLVPSAIDLAGKSTSCSRASAALKIPRMLLSKINVDFAQDLLGGWSCYVLAE